MVGSAFGMPAVWVELAVMGAAVQWWVWVDAGVDGFLVDEIVRKQWGWVFLFGFRYFFLYLFF